MGKPNIKVHLILRSDNSTVKEQDERDVYLITSYLDLFKQISIPSKEDIDIYLPILKEFQLQNPTAKRLSMTQFDEFARNYVLSKKIQNIKKKMNENKRGV
jgi:hypothetical protein